MGGSASLQPSLRGVEVCGATAVPWGWQIGFPPQEQALVWLGFVFLGLLLLSLLCGSCRDMDLRHVKMQVQPSHHQPQQDPCQSHVWVRTALEGSGGLNVARPAQESLAGLWDAGNVPRDPPDLIHSQQHRLEVTWMRLCWSRARACPGALGEGGGGAGKRRRIPSLPIPAAVSNQVCPSHTVAELPLARRGHPGGQRSRC